MAFRMYLGVRSFSTFLTTKLPAINPLIQSIQFQPQLIKASCANVIFRQPQRHIQYRFSPPADRLDANAQPNVKIEQNAAEWQYVEAILPPLTVPIPAVKAEYPSGWRPQTVDPQKTPYFIARSKNHMMPVYLRLTFRNTRRQTVVKRIQGDIWKFEIELRTYLEDHMKKKMSIRVNEFSETITILGDYVNLVKNYLTGKGF